MRISVEIWIHYYVLRSVKKKQFNISFSLKMRNYLPKNQFRMKSLEMIMVI